VAVAWIAVGVVLIAVELHHLAFYALFVAIGCLAAAVVAVALPDALALQVLTAVAVSVVGVLLVRPRVARLVERGPGHRGKGVHGGFVGQEVTTLDTVGDADNIGHVQLAGERWRAVSGSDDPLPAGTRVMITGVEGTTLIVWPADGHLPVDLNADLRGEE
jgi:membrane protein implicated in regulation of membrane protease activity